MIMDWTGHVAIVTGAGSGIGQAIAERFAEVGAAVVVAELNQQRGEAVAAELQAGYGKGLFVRVDVSKTADCRELIQRTIREYGHLDTLVNNAGINFVKPTLETDEADWDRVMNVDLKGAFLCSRYALEVMVPRRRGSIVNIASVHAEATLPGMAPYAAAKAGVKMLAAALAVEFAPYNIRVNSVSPGLTDTAIWQEYLGAIDKRDVALQHWFDNIPMERLQTPREVANVVLFLASDQSTYITGTNITSDGGALAVLNSKAPYQIGPVEGKPER
jgi:NAD(P)-dependent dehydrogenase (short-subunit alcohol dehydrogenase family)